MNPRILAAASLLAAITWTCAAAASDVLLSFEGGVGVHPVAAFVNGAPVVNTVRGVPPGGRPWAIQRLRAHVFEDGRIRVKGEGLVLSATDNIGTRGGVLRVAATLFCGTAEFSSAGVDLSVGGDFSIRDQLSPTPPANCATPILLIRNAPPGAPLGAWFAAGTLNGPQDD